jgi:uncharacterized membrane protein
MSLFIIVILLLLPLLLLKFKENKLISTLGPVMICYAIGILVGNILGFDLSIAKIASEASVPLAIPLLLISCNFMYWLKNSNKTLISFGLVLLSVIIVSTITSFSFADELPEFKKLAAMMVGVYTGGTPNLSAIGLALNISSETFVLLNTADVILGGIYLLFIFTFGKRVYGLFLRPTIKTNKIDSNVINLFESLDFKIKLKRIVLFVMISGATLGGSIGLSQIFFNADNVAFIILFISAVGVALSFNKSISQLAGSYEVGEYFLLVFCISVGMMANLSDMLDASSTILIYASCVMFGSIIFHIIFCMIFKIDTDTAIITSVAGIFGPPFVAPVAESIDNREMIVAGITSGLVGYGVGNFLGLGLYYFLN